MDGAKSSHAAEESGALAEDSSAEESGAMAEDPSHCAADEGRRCGRRRLLRRRESLRVPKPAREVQTNTPRCVSSTCSLGYTTNSSDNRYAVPPEQKTWPKRH